jgi:hypothetical protein
MANLRPEKSSIFAGLPRGPRWSVLAENVAVKSFLIADDHEILRAGLPEVDVPIEQPTKFEVIVNLKIAKTLSHRCCSPVPTSRSSEFAIFGYWHLADGQSSCPLCARSGQSQVCSKHHPHLAASIPFWQPLSQRVSSRFEIEQPLRMPFQGPQVPI